MGRKISRVTQKAIRLESNWNTFFIEHPEIKVVRNSSGKILSIRFPEEIENYSICLINNFLQFQYVTPDGKLIRLPD